MRSNHFLIATVAAALAATPSAQEPAVHNAELRSEPAGPDLSRRIRDLAASEPGPFWLGYAVPAVADLELCCSHTSEECCGRCELEGRHRAGSTTQRRTVSLESSGSVMVLFRARKGSVGRIKVVSFDCELDAGGVPFVWLRSADPEQSLQLLDEFARGDDARLARQAVAAVAVHAGDRAGRLLEAYASAAFEDKLRETALFWMGRARAAAGHRFLTRFLAGEENPRLRRKAVFALYVSREPGALETLVETARRDPSSRVRGQALFWLSQEASERAVAALRESLEDDPDLEVKTKAVFGLSQLPSDEGVPLLIEVARTHPSAQIRKKAMFWLGQSGDSRALAFFEEILLKR